MAEVIGGVWITKSQFTRSFGTEPASASLHGVLAPGETVSGIAVGDYIVSSFAGQVFYGIISSAKEGLERDSGRIWSFNVLDNRIRLRWMLVFGQWNTAEDKTGAHTRLLPRPPEGEFTTGDPVGGDGADFSSGVSASFSVPPVTTDEGSASRGRVFSHIVASQWPVQLRTYTDAPVSAQDIIRNAVKYAVGGYSFSFDFHSGMSEPVFDVDANGGMSMAAFIETIGSQLGLQVTLDGSRTLRWERKGEGTLVVPAPPVHLQEDGEEISAEPSKVRIVGDRTLVQLNNIILVPDWKEGWQEFISEPAWLDEVKTVFALPVTNSAEQAELAARSREITLRQYITAKGEDAVPLIDYGTWDLVSRLNMPVWKYLNEIVYRSYRISSTSEVFGIKLRNLEIHENLLCAVGLNGDNIHYRSNPAEYYPQAAAFVAAKGQPVDLLNFVDREELVRLRSTDMNSVWSEVSDFTVDASTHTIRFASATFKDGDPGKGKSILLFPNGGQGGYENHTGDVSPTSDWLRIVLPNPDYVIAPAQVKVSLVFRLGRFFKDYGTGQRWKPEVVPNIAPHLLLKNAGDAFSHSKTAAFTGTLHTPGGAPGGSSLREVLYENGATAVDLADAQADGLIQRSGTERGGRWVRYGAVGAAVSGVIDRVTVTYDWQSGVSETVEFAKPRPSSGFVSSRDFARRVLTDELFGGQKDLEREIRNLRGIARLERAASRNEVRKTANRVITDIFRRPLGGENPTVKTHLDINSQWPEGRGEGVKWRAGDLMWLDDDGHPSRTGQNFAGAVVASSVREAVVVATDGMVPLAVNGGSTGNLSANPGEWFASNAGSYPIGHLAHGSPAPGSGRAIGLTKLGHGGGGAASVVPLHILSSKPAYIPEPTSPVSPSAKRFYIEWGTVKQVVASNWDAHFDIIATTYFFAKINFAASEDFVISSWEILTGADSDTHVTPGWDVGDPRPAYMVILLGFVNVEGLVHTIANSGGGSIEVWEQIHSILQGTDGETRIGKQMVYHRISHA